MNKTLVTLGVGIWGIMLILFFVFRASLAGRLTCEELNANLLIFPIFQIVAFIITLYGLIKRD